MFADATYTKGRVRGRVVSRAVVVATGVTTVPPGNAAGCIFMRNLLARVPKGSAEMVAAAVRAIFAQPDAAHVRSQLDEVTRMLQGQFPDVAAMLTDATEDLLAFCAFPQAHWREIWSTNPLERLNGEIKRRTRVVGIFPNDASMARLVTAVVVETHDESAVTERRYLSEESMTDLYADLDTEPATQEPPLAITA